MRVPSPALALTILIMVSGMVLSSAVGLRAQDTGGIITRIGIDQGLSYRTNPGLQSPSAPAQARARTGLSFSIASETRTERLAFDASGALELGNRTSGRGLDDLSAALSYRRISARELLEAEIFLRERNVATSDLALGTDPVTGVIVPIVIQGSGTLRRSGARLHGEFGREGPFGGTVTLSRTDSRYRGTIDPSLVNNRRDRLAVTARLDITETATVTLGATRSVLREDAAPSRRRDTFSLGTTLDRPDGAWRATLRTTRTSASSGLRTSLSVGRRLDLPRGALDVNLGAVRSGSGDTRLTGGVNWRHDLPTGQITLDLARSIGGDIRDNDTEQTRLSLRANHEFTPDISGQFGLTLQENRALQNSDGSRGADISLGLAYQLNRDWALQSSMEHQIRQNFGDSRRQGTIVSLSLRRDFTSLR